MIRVRTTSGIQTIENFVEISSNDNFFNIVISDKEEISFNMQNLISYAIIKTEENE